MSLSQAAINFGLGAGGFVVATTVISTFAYFDPLRFWENGLTRLSILGAGALGVWMNAGQYVTW